MNAQTMRVVIAIVGASVVAGGFVFVMRSRDVARGPLVVPSASVSTRVPEPIASASVATIEAGEDAHHDDAASVETTHDTTPAEVHETGSAASDLEKICPATAGCDKDQSIDLDTAPYEELAIVEDQQCGARHVYVHTTKGWYRLAIEAGAESCGDADEEEGAELANAHVVNGTLVFRLRATHAVASTDPSVEWRMASAHEATYACREEQTVRCEQFETAVATIANGPARAPEDAIRWRTTGHIVVNEAGVASLVHGK